jgi:DNA polymerase III delta prime subunit
MKERIDDLFRSSLFGRRKVIILDEVHKLKQPGQSAWLKPLEKLPEDIFVIACTTDHKELLPTFLSRFNILAVKGLSEKESYQLLDGVTLKHGIQLSDWKRDLIVKTATGIPRIIISSVFLLKNVDNPDEASALMDLTAIDVNDKSLDIFKYLLSGADWMTIKEKLFLAFKEVSPDSIRVDLLNILSGRMASKFFRLETEGRKLINIFEALENMTMLPAKAGLIKALLKSHMIMKGGL